MDLTHAGNMLAPRLSPSHPLHGLLEATSGLPAAGSEGARPLAFWGPEHYGLERSSRFRALDRAGQTRVLADLSRMNLGLAYFIEKSGLGFGARMLLESRSLEERSLFAYFCADEARHRALLEPHLPGPPEDAPVIHPILPVLSDAIENAPRTALVYLIQVLLEGFGLAHYRHLRDGAQDEALRSALTSILRDEARHHLGGVILWKDAKPTPKERDEIVEFARRFMVGMATPRWIFGALEKETGPLSDGELARLKEETLWESRIADRARRLRALVESAGDEDVLRRLDAADAFRGSADA